MCGIVGIFNFDGSPVAHPILRDMTEMIQHRGPDDHGIWTEGSVGFGHRRLAIIDLSPRAHQPMQAADGLFTITYNGEIYNYRELKRQLKHRGYAFRSDSDTEVVLKAYQEWGPDCVKRFNGMFAFAIWDGEHHRLFLARDRYGIKPLYYTICGDTLLFASEVKAFLPHNAFDVGVDRSALLEYFTFQNIFSDRTLFKDVRMLPAGHTASIRRSPQPYIEFEQYWDFDFSEPIEPADPREYQEELDRLFTQAVERHLVSDVRVGTFLSGGIDSGAVTAVASKQLPSLPTYTCGFDLSSASGLELGFDERERAEALSARFRTQQYEVVLKAGDMERVMEKLIWHQEDLRVGQCYPNYYIARLASKFSKVVLTGIGGDELFAGYPWRYYRAVTNHSFDEYVHKYYRYWQRLVRNQVIHRLFQPRIWKDIKEKKTIDTFREVINHDRQNLNTPEEYVNRSLYFEAKTFLHGLLMVEDKLTMAHGLEARMPFLDNDLVDFAMKLPVSTKLRNLDEVVHLDENEPGPKVEKYYERTNDGKLILRRVLEQYMPETYTNGVKQGFSAPDASWFRGESIDYVRDVLFDNNAHMYNFLHPDTVRELVSEHLQGHRNRRLLVWSLLSFEEWLRRFWSSTA